MCNCKKLLVKMQNIVEEPTLPLSNALLTESNDFVQKLNVVYCVRFKWPAPGTSKFSTHRSE